MQNGEMKMLHKTTKSEKELEIIMKLGLDPEYITKSKKSICKDCVHNEGFKDENYECKLANAGVPFSVDYKREGVFHAEIIKCTKFRV